MAPFYAPKYLQEEELTMYYLIDLERSIYFDVTHYWKPHQHGYTTNIEEAGWYDEPLASRLVEEDFDKVTVMISVEKVKKILKK